MIIAVDGTAASGKGTLAKRLASHLGYGYLDTGALYRGVALSLLRSGFSAASVTENAAEAAARNLDFDLMDLDDADLRTPVVSDMAAVIAAFSGVRAAVLDFQRDFAAHWSSTSGGAILDGRDIGTVVLPNADVKFFVDADLDIRATRRHKELISRGVAVMLPSVRETLASRDEQDRNRLHAPLKAASDSIMLDTTALDVDGMVSMALTHI